jgi:GH15 family glucan-1,4-alpha-glucosidase
MEAASGCAMIRAVALTTIAALATEASAQGIPPHSSWSTLSWSNGVAAGTYDTARRRLRSFREHLFAHSDETTATRELAHDVYFGLRVAGQNAWLTDRPLAEAGYDGDTGIARVVQRHGDLTATQYFFSPFAAEAAVVVAVVELENTGRAPLADAALFSIQNLHVGGGLDGARGEAITWQADRYEERGIAGLVVHRPLPAPAVHACSPDNPFPAVTAGRRLTARDASGATDDAVAGFEWDLTGLGPGERRTFAVVLGHRGDGDRAALDAAMSALPTDAAALLAAERTGWADFHARAREPAGLAADERAVYRRQLAVLRMAQVREGSGRGQLVASLPPGQWNISWPRDQAYAVGGLIRAGLTAEADAALRFVLGADAGHYVCCDRDGGPWVGAPYAISVTRYYGNGREESDWNERGPNIEFDGFGLTLDNLAELVEATDDDAIVHDHADAIFARTADVLIGLVEVDGPAAGLVRADSSIWETHWYDGGRRHFTYTQATTVLGLRAAATLAARIGRDPAPYRDAADRLAHAIADRLVDAETGILRSSLEESASYLDGAVVEAFNWGVLPGAGDTARSTLDALRAGLWNGAVGHGYRRNDDGGDYDLREWVVVDLRIAAALRRVGLPGAADDLVQWITDQARLNFDLVPENFDRITGDYQGEVPMVGFGAGAYVTALWERGPRGPGPDPAPDAGVPDATPAGDAGAPPGGDGEGDGAGCGCGAGGAPSLVIGLALLALRRRRA